MPPSKSVPETGPPGRKLLGLATLSKRKRTEIARMGGRASMGTRTPAQRSEFARYAALIRHARKRAALATSAA